ncbi:epidermal growth factor-like protein 8 isoform X2 [Rhineura floridana]|uniref:epidermal growth factor-like protein 8 isoform X2 n=1 Tax=Rhineura floridana TaxID=261503 RepID=UPI002AC80021|nr:epidermal growth factor-like protein 8 isoform X2 [Rhineura floridana]
MGRVGVAPAAFLCGGLLAVFLLRAAFGQSKQPESRVCSRRMLRIPLFYNETYAKPLHQPYLTLCAGPRVCSTYKTTYRVATRQVRKDILQTNVICCQGWKKRHLADTKCEEAVCHKPCQNGGICAQPNQCQCQPGWGGRYCHIAQTLAAQDVVPNEIQELQAKVGQLEERLERALSILPTSLEPTQLKELWSRLRYLDQVESLSDQLLFLEEKLGDCACQNGKNGFGYEIA